MKLIRWFYPLPVAVLLAGAFMVSVPAGRAQDAQTETPIPTLSPTNAPSTTLDDGSAVQVINPDQQADLFGAGGGGGCLITFDNGKQLGSIPQLDYESGHQEDCVDGLPTNVQATATILEPDGTVYAQKVADTGASGSMSLFIPNALSLPAGTWSVRVQTGNHTLAAQYELALPAEPAMAVRCDGTKPVVILLGYAPAATLNLALASVDISRASETSSTVPVTVQYLWRLHIGPHGTLVAYPHLKSDPAASLGLGQTLYFEQTDAEGKLDAASGVTEWPYPDCALAAAYSDFESLSAMHCWPMADTGLAMRPGQTIKLPDGVQPVDLFSAPGGFDDVPLPGGTTLTLIDGPYTCANRGIWWKISSDSGKQGWAIEESNASTDFSTYPLDAYCSGFALNTRLWIGAQGRVTPGLPNNLNSKPERPSLHSDSHTIASLPAGATFQVTGGPECADGILWWQVIYRGVTGWTGEGQGNNYWVEPVK